MARYLTVLIALVSVLFFPYSVSLLVTIIAALAVPLAGVAVGMLTDAIYFTPHMGAFPKATVLGLLATIGAFLLRRFMRTRVTGTSHMK